MAANRATTARAVTEGLAGTGRVITAAAAIMIAVFAAFVPSPTIFLKVIGVGMAAAILIDATVVRHAAGAGGHAPARAAATGGCPAWLGRLLPELHIEGHPEAHLPAARPVDTSDGELNPLPQVNAN